MSIFLDLLGSIMIGSMLFLMMLTFQFQLTETATKTVYTMQMIDHMNIACNKLNSVIGLAGIGMAPDSTVTTAGTNKLVFRTMWNYNQNFITSTPTSFEISLSPTKTSTGKAIILKQNGQVINDLGYIFWVDDLAFVYYDKTGALTTTPRYVRTAEIRLTFRRDPPYGKGPVLRTKAQVKCFFMNCYLRGA